MRKTALQVVSHIVLATSLGACADDSRGPIVSVQVESDPARCSIRGTELACAEVAVFLRDELHIGSDEFIEVTSDPEHVTFDALNPVIKSLRSAGFTTVIGSISIEDGRSESDPQ